MKTASLTYLSAVSDPATFDPTKDANSPYTDGPFVFPVYDTVIQVVDGKVVPRLALSVTANADSTQWTVKLRPNVTFSDGTPVNADAVVAYWTRVKDPANASLSLAFVTAMSSFVASDPLTVVVTLAAPDAQWLYKLQTGLGLIPSPTAVAKYGALYGSSPSTTVGAGPFVLSDLIKGSSATYTANPTYWDKGKPYVQQYIIKVFQDPTSSYNTFSTGGGDILQVAVPGPTVTQALSGGKTAQAWDPPPGGVSLAFNMRAGHPTSDPRVRAALIEAVDIPAVITRSSFQGAVAMPTLYPKGSASYSANNPQPGLNVTDAQKQLQSYLTETGQTSITVSIITPPAYNTFFPAMQQDWAKLTGLRVNVVQVNIAGYSAKLVARDFDMIPTQISGTNPGSFVTQFLSTATPTNVPGYNNPAMDQLLGELTRTKDLTKQNAILAQMQANMTDPKNLPMFWLYYAFNLTVANEKTVHYNRWESGSVNVADMWKSGS